jgi:hypothetical protein
MDRTAVDYRKLNNATRSWSMPLPFMSDLQQQLDQARYFTTMDIASGFYNVPMKAEHISYTALCLRNLGLFELQACYAYGVKECAGLQHSLICKRLSFLHWIDLCIKGVHS